MQNEPEFTKQELKDALKVIKRSKRDDHWYWRTCYWLVAVGYCFKFAAQEFKKYYRERND